MLTHETMLRIQRDCRFELQRLTNLYLDSIIEEWEIDGPWTNQKRGEMLAIQARSAGV